VSNPKPLSQRDSFWAETMKIIMAQEPKWPPRDCPCYKEAKVNSDLICDSCPHASQISVSTSDDPPPTRSETSSSDYSNTIKSTLTEFWFDLSSKERFVVHRHGDENRVSVVQRDKSQTHVHLAYRRIYIQHNFKLRAKKEKREQRRSRGVGPASL